MKSNTKKRLIAFMLCMVLVLSSATSAFADEPQNTDSQSQTEAVAEPAADEATGDEANTTDIEIPSEKEWSVQVGNATVKVKGSADALPENAQLSVSEITSEDEVKEIEKAVEEKAIEEQFTVKNIFSYDSHEQNSTHSVFMRVCEAWQPLLSLQIYSNNQLQMV